MKDLGLLDKFKQYLITYKKIIAATSAVLCFGIIVLLYQYMNSQSLNTDLTYVKNNSTSMHKSKIYNNGNYTSNRSKSSNSNRYKPSDISYVNVYICGSVKEPGVYKAESYETLNDLVVNNGGFSPKADLNRVNLAKKLKDGEKIYIPYVGEKEQDINRFNDDTTDQSSIGASSLNSGTGSSNSSSEPYSSAGSSPKSTSVMASNNHEKININSATEEQLDSLPNIGPKKAQAIIDYRSAHGGFKTINELDNISRIGQKTIEKLKDYICVN